MSRVTQALVLIALLALAVGLWQLWPNKTHSTSPTQGLPVSVEYSNLRHADYVGPELCNDCHEERYQQWSNNLHRKMNRMSAEPGAVLGDFEDRRVPYGTGAVLLSHDGERYSMAFEEEGTVTRRYRITRTIGSRYLQEYVGVQEEGPEPAHSSVYSTEIRLPFGYLFRTRRWLPQEYFDSWHGREYTGDDALRQNVYEPDTAPWRGRCAWCHNTYSFDKRLARLHGDSQIGNGIEQFFVDSAKPDPDIAASNLLPTEELVSVGISCESCHFGAREHALLSKPIRFVPVGGGVSSPQGAPIVAGTRQDPVTINAICAQCHSAPTDLYPNGAGSRNSSEALDLLSGACATRIKCTDCHDPHIPGPGAMADDQAKHVGACLGCHQNLADVDMARSHSKHDAKVSCLDCHMPRIVQGVSSLLRSHRIDSPTQESMLNESVNACNLCHLDKSVAWTVRSLNEHYGKSIAQPQSESAAALQWLGSEERIHRLTAAGALGISPQGHIFLPQLLAKLNDPVAYDRQRYLWAIEEVIGRTLEDSEFSLTSGPTQRSKQTRCLQRQAAKWSKLTDFPKAPCLQ